MKKFLLLAVTLFFFYSCTEENITSIDFESPDHVSNVSGDKIIPGKYIVVLKSGGQTKGMPEAVRAKVLEILTRNGAASAAIDHFYSTALQGFSATLSPGLLKKLESDADIAYIEMDQEFSIDQRGNKGGKPGGGGSTQPAQSTPWGITRIGGAASGIGKTAWIIDTGIDLDHPDLNVDASKGFSAFTRGKDSGLDDGNGHGTHCAGTVAAIDNAIGVVGVAAGATVIPVKVLSSSGSGSNSGVIAGVDHVAQYGQPGDVANMSLGGGISTALDQAVLNAAAVSGVKFSLAAGNSSADANTSSPARVNGNGIYTVSAHNINNIFASFSNYGNPPVDFCAPGVSIASTWLSGGYNTISGTSMAAPHVAGILLLGNISSRGAVSGDPDGNPDPMASR